MSRSNERRCCSGRILALSLALAGCGGVEEVASHAESVRIAQLPTASRALLELPLPGCAATASQLASATGLLRHPDAEELAVVMVADRPLCVDTVAALLPTGAVALARVRIPTAVMAGDTPRDDDPVPITNGGDDPRAQTRGDLGGNQPRGDDPVPIHGDLARQATDRPEDVSGSDQPQGDDPVPIHERSTTSEANLADDDVDDDPVPIQPGVIIPRPAAAM